MALNLKDPGEENVDFAPGPYSVPLPRMQKHITAGTPPVCSLITLSAPRRAMYGEEMRRQTVHIYWSGA